MRDSAGDDIPFVGRTRELAMLHGAFERALRGEPAVALVTGDDGIGKSSLVEHFVGMAAAKGVQPRTASMTATTGLHELVSDLRLTPDEQRLPSLVLERTLREEVLLWIDDVQLANGDTLRWLRDLAFAVVDEAAARAVSFMMVLTARTPQNDSTQSMLDQIRAESRSLNVMVGALDDLDAAELLSNFYGSAVGSGTVRLLLDRSGGNPRRLLRIARDLGPVTTPSELAESRYPELAERLASVRGGAAEHQGFLTSAEPEVLDVARCISLLGAFGGPERVAAVLDIDPAGVHSVIASLRSELPHAFDERDRIADPSFAEELRRSNPGRYRELQHRTGLALSAATDPSLHVAGARHLVLANDSTLEQRSLGLVAAGADAAWNAEQWETCAWLWEAAATLGAYSNADRAERHIRAARGWFRSLDGAAVRRNALAAIDLAQQADDVERWGLAAMVFHHAQSTTGMSALAPGEAEEVLEQLLAYGETKLPKSLLASVRIRLCISAYQAFDFPKAEQLRSLVDPADLDTTESQAVLLDADGLLAVAKLDMRAARSLADNAAEVARAAGGRWMGGTSHSRLSLFLAVLGDLRRTETESRLSAELAASTRDWAEHASALAARVLGLAARGSAEGSEQLGEQAWRSYQRSKYTFSALTFIPSMAYLGAVAGSSESSERWLSRYREATGFPGTAMRWILSPFLNDRPDQQTLGTLNPQATLPGLSQAAALIEGAVSTTASGTMKLTAAEDVLSYAEQNSLRFGFDIPYFIPRLRGLAAWYSGRFDEAGKLLQDASILAMSCGAELEIARCLIDRARVANSLGDRAEAESLFDQAADVADRLGAFGVLSLVETARQKPGGRGIALRDRFILFTDIVGSTRHNNEIGDAEWLRVLRQHDDRMAQHLRKWRGVTFKHTGDGLHAWFDSPDDAALCALRMHEDLETDRIMVGESALQIRCAIVQGQPIADRGDLFGTAMSLAARLCDRAEPGEVLVTETVCAQFSTTRITRGTASEFVPKGFAASTRYAPLLRRPSVSADTYE